METGDMARGRHKGESPASVDTRSRHPRCNSSRRALAALRISFDVGCSERKKLSVTSFISPPAASDKARCVSVPVASEYAISKRNHFSGIGRRRNGCPNLKHNPASWISNPIRPTSQQHFGGYFFDGNAGARIIGPSSDAQSQIAHIGIHIRSQPHLGYLDCPEEEKRRLEHEQGER